MLFVNRLNLVEILRYEGKNQSKILDFVNDTDKTTNLLAIATPGDFFIKNSDGIVEIVTKDRFNQYFVPVNIEKEAIFVKGDKQKNLLLNNKTCDIILLKE